MFFRENFHVMSAGLKSYAHRPLYTMMYKFSGSWRFIILQKQRGTNKANT